MATINPGLRMVRRGGHSVQIGMGAGGKILTGLQDAEMEFVEALHHGIADKKVMEKAAALGVDILRAQEICTKLMGLLFTDADLRTQGFRAERLLPERLALLGLYQGPCNDFMTRREQAVVHLIGLGRTGAALAAVLVSAGLGTILLEDDRAVGAADVGPGAFALSDIGLARSIAVRRQLLRIDPGTQAHVVHDGGASAPGPACLDLAVMVGHDTASAETAARFLAAERPHLFVLLREQDGTIGPLVVPGETACAECVDRNRTVVDPQWLDVSSQLAAKAAHPPGRKPRAEHLENVALAMTLAGAAATQILLFLDAVNQPNSWSSVLTFHQDNGRWTRQEFSAHPDCGCQWQNQSLARISKTASP